MHYLSSLFVRNKNDKKTEKGFVLLLSMLVISVILSISLSIFAITIKGVVLSQYLTQSEKAFLAADKAIECALFWDRALPTQSGGLRYSPFPTSTAWNGEDINTNNVICGGLSSPASGQLDDVWTATGIDADEGETTYTVVYTDGSSADVMVEKEGINTVVTSNGYNTSDASNARRTQRTIVARYNL